MDANVAWNNFAEGVYARVPDTEDVPDGGATLVILGLALLGIGAVRRIL